MPSPFLPDVETLLAPTECINGYDSTTAAMAIKFGSMQQLFYTYIT